MTIEVPFGSEVRSNKDVPRYPGIAYRPPLRKKIYDRSLPKICSQADPRTFSIIT